jgi:hypothetical protein
VRYATRMLAPSRQFHLVPLADALEGDVAFRAITDRYTAVDVQLSSDPLAADRAFTEENGDELGPGHYRHRSLADKLGEAGMARVRRFFTALLLELTREGDRLVWFADGGLDDLDDEHDDDRLVLRGGVADARLNGSFVLSGGERGQLAHQAQRLGNHDRLRAVAGPGLSLAAVLPRLTLASPVPTCSARLDVGHRPFAALGALLPFVGLFFEELKNGTRLRLVSGLLSPEEMGAAVANARDAAGPFRRV